MSTNGTSMKLLAAFQTATDHSFFDSFSFEPMFNGTVDANGLNNPRAPWPIVNGAAGHYDVCLASHSLPVCHGARLISVM
jgi:hypothetical protein